MPLPTNGVGNTTHAPLFVEDAGGNLRLLSATPDGTPPYRVGVGGDL